MRVDTDKEAHQNANRSDMAGKYHKWCADCGAKNHTNRNECCVCGYGDESNGELFGVNNKLNVGRSKYTSDGEQGTYKR
jgi:ribosomal protein L37E